MSNSNDNVENSTEPKFNIQVDVIGETPDDSELIDAYERAVKNAKQKILQKRPELRLAENGCDKTEDAEVQPKNTSRKSNKSNKRKDKGVRKWAPGKHCRAVYSGDNEEYEAVICTLNPERDECVVKFAGYGSKEKILISSLKPSLGPAAILEQKIRASATVDSTASELNESFFSPSSTCASQMFIPLDVASDVGSQAMPMPPIPPPPMLAGRPVDSLQSLSSVLMAWYMAGYHTGFYEASNRTKENKPYRKM